MRTTRFTVMVLIALLAIACRRNGGMMMSNDQMMQHMRDNPAMMSGMMNQMMRDPKMMQQMMDHMMRDPKAMQQMSDAMIKNPQACVQMMDKMMGSPEHRKLMVQQMTKHAEACRGMMQEMANRAGGAEAKQIMDACARMMQPAAGTSTTTTVPPAASPAPTARGSAQEYTINVGADFSPNSLTVEKGKPVRLHFRRTNEPTCANQVVLPDLGIERDLKANSTTTVEFTPEKAGRLSFGCGMNMLSGQLVVR